MEFKFLWLTVDENLNWNFHIQKVSDKIFRTLGIMCRLKNSLPLNRCIEFPMIRLFYHISNMKF